MQELRENKPFCALYLAVVAVVVTTVVGSGCQQLGPAWMSHPFAGAVPQYKSEYGPTPSQRVVGLQQLASRAGEMSDADAARTAQELTEAYQHESDPILRRAIVETLGTLKGRHNDEALHLALSDPVASVRVAACEAWAKRGDVASAAVLHERLTTDSDPDVRRNAIRALAQCQTPDTIQYLATALDDRDPALQVTAMETMRHLAGQDLGNDVNAWRQYAASQRRSSAAATSPPVGSTVGHSAGPVQ